MFRSDGCICQAFVGAIFGCGTASEVRWTRCRRDFLYLADCATGRPTIVGRMRQCGRRVHCFLGCALADMESCSRFRALSRAQPLSGKIELVGCGVRAFVFVGRFHGRCFCSRFEGRPQYSTSATSQKVRVQTGSPYMTVQEATLIVCIPAQSFTYRPRAHTTTIMSSPKLSP